MEKDDYYWQTKVRNPRNICKELRRYRFYGKFIDDKQIHQEVQNLKLDEVNAKVEELFADAKIQAFVYGNATKGQVYTIKQIRKKFN